MRRRILRKNSLFPPPHGEPIVDIVFRVSSAGACFGVAAALPLALVLRRSPFSAAATGALYCGAGGALGGIVTSVQKYQQLEKNGIEDRNYRLGHVR